MYIMKSETAGPVSRPTNSLNNEQGALKIWSTIDNINVIAYEFSLAARITIFKIVTERLSYHKLCARRLPNRHKNVKWAGVFGSLSRRKDVDILRHTGNYSTVMQCRHSTSPKQKKSKQTSYTTRQIAFFFVELMESGTLIIAAMDCETLTKPISAIKLCKCGKLSTRIVLLQENACPHTATRTKKKIHDIRWKLFHDPL